MTEPTPAPSEPPAQPAPRHRAAKAASIAVAALLVAAGAGAAVVAAAWRSEAATRWLLQHLPGVTAVDVQGSLGGGDLRVGSLRAIAGGTQVDVAGLRLAGLGLHWHPAPRTWLGVSFSAWDADTVRVKIAPAKPSSSARTAPPTSLRSPVALDVERLHAGSVAIGDAAPLRDVRARLAIGADGGQLHRVDHLSLGWERVHAEGQVQARTDAPLQVDAEIEAHDTPDAATPPAAASYAPTTTPALPHWHATATLHGPLAALDLAATLQGDPRAGRAAPHAQATARVTPFAALPVGQVLVQTAELDLSALSAHAPATRLEGSLRIATTRPAALAADLRNLAPAAWSAGGLPFSALAARLEAPWNGQYVAIPALRLALADAQGPGGELRLQGRWEGDKAQVQLDLDQVHLARLDAHLGAWRIGGPLRAEFEQLPPPSALLGGAPASAPAASSGASAADEPASSPSPSPFAAAVVHLTGRLAGTTPPLGTGKDAVAPPPMSLVLDALLRADALQLKQLELKAGAATASARGALSLGKDDRWQGSVDAQWAQLDPGAWWRLADSGPLRTGPNLLNGSLSAQLASAPGTWQGLAGVRGKLDLVIAASQLAGLPLEGKASLDAGAAPWKLAAELHSGENQAHADGTLDPGTATADALAVIDRLHLSVDAPALAMFAPLAGGPREPAARAATPADVSASAVASLAATKTIPGELVAKAATKVASGGKTTDAHALAAAVAASSASAAASAQAPARTQAADGSWPVHGAARLDVQISGGRLAIAETPGRRASPPAHPLRIVTQGELTDWSGPSLRLQKLQWDADASTDPQAPLSATVTLRDGQWGAAHIAQVDATLSGTLAEHRLQVQGAAPVSPPLWLAHLANIGNADATRLDAQLQGRWQPDAANAPAWQGRLAQFDLRAANTTANTAANTPAPHAPAASVPAAAGPAWIHLHPVDLSLSRDAAGNWQTLRVGAGQAEFAGLTLNWQPSFWTAPPAPDASAHWAFDAALAPFSVAQLLARAQPDLGWHGDLQMSAALHAAFDGRWHVDGRLARTSGDLSVADLVQDPTSTRQALGLTAALLQVKAEGADWRADADVAGTRLGELSGHWTAQAPSPASLPAPGSPLSGNVKAHVADLNVWGAWLPPGWRLGGELRTDLALSGRWGAPQLTGQLTAQQLVIRNALEGVYGHDGEVSIRLTGDQARIERFHLVGGNGELDLTGTASLGAAPVARLQAQAREFQLLGRIDRKLIVTGALGLQLAADAIKVDGRLGIDEGLFDISKGDAPTLDGDVEVLDGSGSAPGSGDTGADAGPPPPPKVSRTTSVDLAVDLGRKLHLRGRGIDTSLQGALQITSPNGQLAVHGIVHTAGGQYTAYGQKLQVSRGEVTFTGLVNDPRLDILATRPNLDVTVGVAITGTALAPKVKLYSEPEMTDTEKLSWLMLGRAPDTAGGPADTALLQQAAIALLAGEDEAPTDQLLKRLGLTDFALRQQTDANDVRQTVVSLGRQISRRVYVGYERGVNATTGNWQLIYRIAQRLTVRAQSGEDNSADVIYTWRWN